MRGCHTVKLHVKVVKHQGGGGGTHCMLNTVSSVRSRLWGQSRTEVLRWPKGDMLKAGTNYLCIGTFANCGNFTLGFKLC